MASKTNGEKITKNDFIELEFTGRVDDTNEIFDTNVKADAEKANLNLKKDKLKPFILSVGNKMLPAGLDLDIEGKDLGKEYEVSIEPKDAFGIRDSKKVRMIPTKYFHEQNINPQRGMQLSLDGQLVRVLSSSSGRTLVDFNNPLAGKRVKYSYKVLRKVKSKDEQINALQDFLFRKQFPFKLDEKNNKIIFSLKKEEEQFSKFLEMMSKPFEDILGMKAQTEILSEQDKSEDSKQKEAK